MAYPQRGLSHLAARPRTRRGPLPRRLAVLWPAVGLALAAALTASCRPPDTSDVDVRWTLRPDRPRVGPATLTVTLTEPHASSSGTDVRVVGHMTHPGMAPVVATTTRRGPGIYDANMNLTMAGDWVLLVTVQLADGRRVERRVDVPGVQ